MYLGIRPKIISQKTEKNGTQKSNFSEKNKKQNSTGKKWKKKLFKKNRKQLILQTLKRYKSLKSIHKIFPKLQKKFSWDHTHHALPKNNKNTPFDLGIRPQEKQYTLPHAQKIHSTSIHKIFPKLQKKISWDHTHHTLPKNNKNTPFDLGIQSQKNRPPTPLPHTKKKNNTHFNKTEEFTGHQKSYLAV